MNLRISTVLKFLLDNGADTNIKYMSNTLLTCEAKYGNSENISLLLKHGANIYEKDEQNNNAFYYAQIYLL